MLKVGETVAEARNNRYTPSSMTPTNWTASGLGVRATERSVRRPTKEMHATYAEEHTAMPGAPR